MDISWDDARLFLAVAEGGSVSAASRALHVAQPTVSRRLAQLEDTLGFPLFQRTTSGTALTAQGERLVEPAKKMAEWAAELARTAEARDSAPRGVVRVTAPPGVAFDFLVPLAALLKKKHPELHLQVLSSVEYLDLVRGEADLALRLRAPAQRDLMTVATFDDKIAAVASPEYAARIAKEKPALAALDFIGWAPPLERMSPNPELAALIPGWRPSFAADDFLVQLRACEEGLGIMFLSERRLKTSRLRLVRLKMPIPAATAPLHLVCARRALDALRVRVVADLIVKHMKDVAR